ncbi:single-stranded DNA-binding protein [Amedibacterium intestinale]|nr:single-stranded DNA-binding protein [Amedibacterium intestinale]
MNLSVFVGNVKEKPELMETPNGKFYAKVVISVERAFQNSEGITERDDIEFIFWNGLAKPFVDGVEKGSIVSVKARVQSRKYKNTKNETKLDYEFIVEKYSILVDKK